MKQEEMTPYEQGFLSKCAELGVDPEALMKYAGQINLGAIGRFFGRLRGVPKYINRGLERVFSPASVERGLNGVSDMLMRPVVGPSMSRAARIARGQPHFGERLMNGGSVHRGAKSVEELLESPEIGAFGPGFGGFSSQPSFVQQLARLRAARQGVDASGVPVPSSLRGTASPQQYTLLQKIIENARRNAAPGQIAAV